MIETGEYARMKSGEILKITGTCYEIDDYKIYKTDRNYTIVEDEIKSHSKNIADVIEAGDFVNGEKVVAIFEVYPEVYPGEVLVSKRVLTEYRTAQYTGLDLQYYLYEEDIKSVLTHEQYEQNCYRLEE